jgi:hypothetical protein
MRDGAARDARQHALPVQPRGRRAGVLPHVELDGHDADSPWPARLPRLPAPEEPHRALQLLLSPVVDENRRMFRKVGAVIGLFIVVGLALALMWRVYLHHRLADHRDEPPVVSLPAPAGMNVKTSGELA